MGLKNQSGCKTNVPSKLGQVIFRDRPPICGDLWLSYWHQHLLDINENSEFQVPSPKILIQSVGWTKCPFQLFNWFPALSPEE